MIVEFFKNIFFLWAGSVYKYGLKIIRPVAIVMFLLIILEYLFHIVVPKPIMSIAGGLLIIWVLPFLILTMSVPLMDWQAITKKKLTIPAIILVIIIAVTIIVCISNIYQISQYLFRIF